MAFLKFSRDKRGYEHFCLVQPSNRGKSRPRVLYWFRTPPNIKVGRSPFAPEIRRALEAQNPDVAFDWEAIVHTPIPPPVEQERWRERRRVERAMRAAEGDEVDSIAGPGEPSPQEEISAPIVQAIDPEPVSPAVEVREVDAPAEPLTASNSSSSAPPATLEGPAPRQGRRRRRRRGRRPSQVQGSQESPVTEAQKSVAPDGRKDEV